MKAAARELLRHRRQHGHRRRPRRPSSPRCPSLRRTTTSSATRSSGARSVADEAAIARPARASSFVPPDTDDRPAAQRHPRPAGRAAGRRCPARSTRRRTSRPPSGEDVVLAQPGHAAMAGAPLRLGRPRRAHDAAVRSGCRDVRSLEAGGLRVTTTIDLAPPEDRREVGQGRGARAASEGPGRLCQDARASRRTRRGCGTSRTRTSATARSSRSTTRPASSSPTSVRRDYYATKSSKRVPAPVRRRRPGLSPAGLGVQAVQLRDRHRGSQAHGRHDAHGQSPPISAAATRRATPTTSSAARSASATPCSSRSTSPPSRRWPSTRRAASSQRAQDFGMKFQSGSEGAGLALALGVAEVRPVDLVTAYGTLANGGKRRRPYDDPVDQGQAGNRPSCRRTRRRPARQVVSQQTSFIVTDILQGNTNPAVNPFWGQFRGRARRRDAPPGDAQDRHEQRRQGPQRLRLHRPADQGRPRRRGLCARGGRLGRQQRQHAGLDAGAAGLLDRRRDVRLAGLPRGGVPQVAGHEVRAAGRRAHTGRDRSLDGPPSTRARRSTNGS